MLAEERRREILGVLHRNGRVTVDEIVARFGVSAVTARSDLSALSDSGELVRSHGGGLRPLAATASPDVPLRVREGIRHEQKTAIAEVAVKLLRPNQSVVLGTGSTSVEIARQLRRYAPDHLTVITYALNVAAQLADVSNISLLMIGGILRQVSNAFVGPQAEEMMESLHADHCFLPAVGFDPVHGVTTLDVMEAQLNRCILKHSTEVSLVADSSKFGHRSVAFVTGFSSIHRLITDNELQTEQLSSLAGAGVQLLQPPAVQ